MVNVRKGLSASEAGKLGAIESAKNSNARKQFRINTWNSNPKLCKFCHVAISYESRRKDFCNHSCAAAFNNQGIRRHGKEQVNCLNCENKTSNEKFCSHKCNSIYDWNITKLKLIKSGIDNSNANYIAKKYLIELNVGKCQICLQSEWEGQPMPLILDHINGNPYDNTINNLRVICHNCNAQTPTFAGRNKGNGRFERAKRYQIEKETIHNMKADAS